MSVKASRYALDVCRADRTLGAGDRTVLLALAAAADYRTHDTYTGAWLAEAAGLNESNTRRHVIRLYELGYVAAVHRRGLASVIRFPIAGTLAAAAELEGRTDENGAYHPTICRCPDCAELAAEG
jgi:DNA-binding transcriptional ArsR family regulator